MTVDFPRHPFLSLFRTSRHCEHSEQGEPSDSELSQHASLFSWQRRFLVMWQLKATLPSSQSSRKSATTSHDQSCPMTSMARHSLLCSYSSPPQEVSLAEQELIHSGALWTTMLPHVSQIRRLTTTRPSFTFCCQTV